MALHEFIQIGDAHLGAAGDRNADRYAALDRILEAGCQSAAAGRLAAWLWPGDLAHARCTIPDSNQLDRRIQAMAMLAPVVICYGNHDEPGDLDGYSRLRATFPIAVIDRPQVLELQTATRATAAIFVLPYVHRAGLVAAGVAHGALGEQARIALEPIFLAAAHQLHADAAAGAIPLMIGHINVGGAIASTGQPQIGQEIEIDRALLARLGPIFKGLNHVHKHQTIGHDPRGAATMAEIEAGERWHAPAADSAVYAGSICRMDFGEAEAKGYLLAQYEDAIVELEGAAIGDRWRWRFVELLVPPQYAVAGTLTREAFTIDTIDGELILTETAAGFWHGADVRVRYRYRKAEIGALDLAKIHAEFAEARSLKLEGQPALERELRAPEIAAATSLEAKAEAYCRRAGDPWSASLADKLAALQAQPGERLLAALAERLAAPAAEPALEEAAR